jgi:hypothetical protein
MILRYTPLDGAPRTWDLSTVRFLTSEAETVERTTALEWSQIIHRSTLVVRKSPTALRALLWVLLKRDQPTLRYSAVDPAVGEVEVKLGADDAAELRAEAEQRLTEGKGTEEEFEEAMRDLDDLTDPDALATGQAALVDGPKAEPPPAHEAELARP